MDAPNQLHKSYQVSFIKIPLILNSLVRIYLFITKSKAFQVKLILSSFIIIISKVSFCIFLLIFLMNYSCTIKTLSFPLVCHGSLPNNTKSSSRMKILPRVYEVLSCPLRKIETPLTSSSTASINEVAYRKED